MNNQAKVGLFVMIIAIVLIVTIYYVGNEQWGRHLTPYRTYSRYAGRAEPGSEVLFGGIEVGRVTAMRAWNQDPTKIEILLEIKEGTPVNANSVAKLGAVSIMSSPAISVTTGTNDARRLKPSEVIRSEETTSLYDMARRFSGIEFQGRLNYIRCRITSLQHPSSSAEIFAKFESATSQITLQGARYGEGAQRMINR